MYSYFVLSVPHWWPTKLTVLYLAFSVGCLSILIQSLCSPAFITAEYSIASINMFI